MNTRFARGMGAESQPGGAAEKAEALELASCRQPDAMSSTFNRISSAL